MPRKDSLRASLTLRKILIKYLKILTQIVLLNKLFKIWNKSDLQLATYLTSNSMPDVSIGTIKLYLPSSTKDLRNILRIKSHKGTA